MKLAWTSEMKENRNMVCQEEKQWIGNTKLQIKVMRIVKIGWIVKTNTGRLKPTWARIFPDIKHVISGLKNLD